MDTLYPKGGLYYWEEGCAIVEVSLHFMPNLALFVRKILQGE